MASGKKIGVSDIAKHAGVSIGTVSNYLNYPERVSDILKHKIAAAIDELGYVPRHANTATTPATAQTDTPLIGFVMTDIEHSLFTAIFEGAQEVCEDNDMQIIGLNASSDMTRQHELVQLLINMNVKGILLSTVLDPTQDVQAARTANIPIVLIDHSMPHKCVPVCSVLENNVSVGRLAAEELLRCGCSRIAFAAHSFDYEAIQDRQLGVNKAVMASGGATFEVIDSGGLMYEDGYQLGEMLSERALRIRAHDMTQSGQVSDQTVDQAADQTANDSYPRSQNGQQSCNHTMSSRETVTPIPDGIVAGSDRLAMGLIAALTNRGVLRVPKDIAIVGTEGVDLQSIGVMPLSVAQAPGADMGRKAMSQLLDYADSPASHVHGTTLIEPTLIPRASTRG